MSELYATSTVPDSDCMDILRLSMTVNANQIGSHSPGTLLLRSVNADRIDSESWRVEAFASDHFSLGWYTDYGLVPVYRLEPWPDWLTFEE